MTKFHEQNAQEDMKAAAAEIETVAREWVRDLHKKHGIKASVRLSTVAWDWPRCEISVNVFSDDE